MTIGEFLLAKVFARGPVGERIAAWAEKDLARIIGEAPETLERTLARLARFSERTATLFLRDAKDIALALRAYFPRAFREGLERLSEKDWLELLVKSTSVGQGQFKKLKGFIRELLVPHMAEFDALIQELEAEAARGGGRWAERVRIVREATDLSGKELGDYLLVVESSARKSGEPEEVWIMAIIESKSLSNADDLVGHGEASLIGQHQWDLKRITSTGGIRIDGHEIPKHRLRFGTPWTRGAQEEFATRFIGVAPRRLTTGEANRVEFTGIAIEVWQHIVDDKTLDDVAAVFLKASGTM